ncbi:MAG TPA: hypothetical protein VKG25_16310 [Bryobacteraceae bacterium]|nr:hypothetical protein [Bryobacteraceae bacterium]
MQIILTAVAIFCLSGVAASAIAKMIEVEMQDLKPADVQATSDDDIKKIVTSG